jgi:hypothetical protein
MNKIAMTALGGLLIGGTTIYMTTVSARHLHKAPTAASEQFRDVYNSASVRRIVNCKAGEPGNPYDMSTDYQGWSAWRQLGAWDSRNDCN